MVMSSTYIQDTKYQLYLLKIVQNSPKNIQKIGFSIYKPNLELNLISEENIDLLLDSNLDFIESKVNIGFVNICGIACFLFACNDDIKEKGKIDEKQKLKVYKLKNIHYIPLIPYLTPKAKNIITTEFNHIKKFLLKDGLFFCDNPFRLDIDLKGQIESFQDINIKYKLFENFQYNHEFAPTSCQKILSTIVKGYYRTIHYTNNSNEKCDLNIAMRYKIYENSKYLIEIEIFIPPTQNNPEIFQTIFYAYFNEFDDKTLTLKNLIENWIQNFNSFQQKEKIENYGVIINFHNNKDDINYGEIQNLSNFEIINLNKIKNLENTLYKFIDSFKEIGYNYKYNNIEYNSQNKILILISNDFKNLFSMIKNVATILFSIFLKDRNYKSNAINSTNEGITKEFKKAEKKLKKFIKDFPKRMEINIINDSNFEIIKKNIANKEENKEIEVDSNQIYEIKQIESYDINNNSIKLFIGTYNVNALDSSAIKTVNLSPFLFPDNLKHNFTEKNFPIFYCIGLEETVELNPKNILMKPKNRAEDWEERISFELQKRFNYFLLCKVQLVGILLLFYVKASEMKYLRNIHIDKLKSGFMGCGNKGCCFLNFEYKGKKFGFCSCHLPAGQKQKNLINRKDTFNHILSFKAGKSENEFKNNDFYFIFGDLNFRTVKVGLISLKNHIKIILADKKVEEDDKEERKSIKISNERPKLKVMKRLKTEVNFENKIKNDSYSNQAFKGNKKNNLRFGHNNYSNEKKVQKKNEEIKDNLMDENIFIQSFFNDFLDGEELKIFKKTELVQFNIEEGEINFPPTYKYKKDTNCYNISKRVPSWTDRILYKNNENIKTLFYDRIDLNFSDHKPIVGFFEINEDEK